MTREEAKELLIHVLMTYEPRDQYGDWDDSEPYEEAMTMAIEALQNLTKPNEDDIISRGDAVALVNRAIRGTDNKEIQEYLFDGLRKDMWSLPSADRPTGEWIPVSERLPIPPTFCLVTTDGSHGDVIDIALYMSDGWHKASEVLAWMPLPEPYKGGDSE